MPRIITNLNELRTSGRMCPEGWSTLLTGLGKTKADDEPLDVLTCLPISGCQDTLWHLPNWPHHDTEYRRLALSFARGVVHMADDPGVAAILDRMEEHLDEGADWDAVVEAVPRMHRDFLMYDVHLDWALCPSGEAATAAVVLTALPNACFAPWNVALAAEEAEFKAHGESGRKAAELRHTNELRAFLSRE